MPIPEVITIDGPAGAGKSTLGAILAGLLGYLYFDTGVMYRALAWAALEHGVDPDDDAAAADLARAIEISVLPADAADGRQYTVRVDGADVTWELRRPDVERAVSPAARHPAVRDVMRARQRAIGREGRVVMVGRDIGRIVMPDAPLKFYLDASVEERARRRTHELRERGREVQLAEVQAEIARRDELDRHVMQPADDAIILVSDGLSPQQVAEVALGFVRRADP